MNSISGSMSLLRRAALLCVVLLTAACGGGGGGGGDGGATTGGVVEGRRGDERSGSGGGGGAGSAPTFTVGGNVSGLLGTGLVLRNNGGDDLTPGNGPFTFPTALPTNSSYQITASTPSNPTQTCTVAPNNGVGTVATADVTNLQVTCTTNTYKVGGTVSGLSDPGDSLTIQNNGGSNYTLTANGLFDFPDELPSGSVYNVAVLSHPVEKECSVVAGTDTVTSSDVSTIVITCSAIVGPLPTMFTVGGSVSGLVAGGSVVLQNNGIDTETVGVNGSFSFAAPLADGAPYVVTVDTPPTNQVCSVTNGSGSIAAGNVTNVIVNCTTPRFTVGGTVTGLSGAGLKLRNNGGNDLSIGANGSFTFTAPLASGTDYTVTVATHPSGPSQNCVVTNGGPLPISAAVTNIVVTCAPWTKQLGTPGYDSGYAVATDATGNVYVALEVAGGLDGNAALGGADVLVIKYRADGQKVWSGQVGSAGNDLVNAIGVDPSGNVYVGGGTGGNLEGTNAGNSDAFIAKLRAADGVVVWKRQFGTSVFDAANAIAVGTDAVYLAGETDGNLGSGSAGNSDVFVRKLDFDGNTLWSRQFGTAVYDAANAIAVDASGVYIAGETDGALPGRTTRGNSDIFAAMLNPGTGDQIWITQFGTAFYDAAKAIAVDATSIYIAGETDGDLDGANVGDSDIFAASLNRANGARGWTRQLGSPAYDAARGVTVDASGVYISGETDGTLATFAGGGDSDAFVAKYELNGGAGTPTWTRQFGTPVYDAANAIAVAPGGTIYLAGETDAALPNGHVNLGGSDAFIVRYGSDGAQK